MYLFVSFAVANDVYCFVDSFTHREFVGNVFARDVVASAMSWRCAYEFEACCDIYAFFGCKSFEWCESLVVVHSKHSIVVLEFARAE